MFYNPGKKLGEWVADRPHLAKHFGKLDLPELFKVGVFEAFYTSVCTAALYVSSRFFANKLGEYGHEKNQSAHETNVSANATPPTPNNSTEAAHTTQPSVQVSGAQNVERLANNFSLGQAAT